MNKDYAALFPVFSSSDAELDRTYAYRCRSFAMHIKDTPAGQVITEFLPDVPWAGVYNTINCAAMHHFAEGRWMSDRSPLLSYARFWCGEGDPYLYSFPFAASLLGLSEVTGDTDILGELYSSLTRIARHWDDHKVTEGPLKGMYRQSCNRDGMEFSVSGDGVRPTVNSYMFADFAALSDIAAILDRRADSIVWKTEADRLRHMINDNLYCTDTGMYITRGEGGENRPVREQVGYIPWIYGIPESGGDAFRYLLDTDVFAGKYGLTTADRSHPDYMKHFDHECLWNGPVWPFATTQTLDAVIAYLQGGGTAITPDDFTRMLLTYAYSQRDEDGTPYVDENMHPDTGVWLARSILREWGRKDMERGRHYNHSAFIDLVLRGIVGIVPSSGDTLRIAPLGKSLDSFTADDILYHGRKISVEWDRRAGMKVSVDGKPAGEMRADGKEVTVIVG